MQVLCHLFLPTVEYFLKHIHMIASMLIPPSLAQSQMTWHSLILAICIYQGRKKISTMDAGPKLCRKKIQWLGNLKLYEHTTWHVKCVARLLEWVTKLKTTDAIQRSGCVTHIRCLASTAPGVWQIMHGCETYNGMIHSVLRKLKNICSIKFILWCMALFNGTLLV